MSINNALSQIKTNALVIGIDTDQLLPTTMQKELVAQLENGTYAEVTSTFGHDGFVVETAQITTLINNYLNKEL